MPLLGLTCVGGQLSSELSTYVGITKVPMSQIYPNPSQGWLHGQWSTAFSNDIQASNTGLAMFTIPLLVGTGWNVSSASTVMSPQTPTDTTGSVTNVLTVTGTGTCVVSYNGHAQTTAALSPSSTAATVAAAVNSAITAAGASGTCTATGALSTGMKLSLSAPLQGNGNLLTASGTASVSMANTQTIMTLADVAAGVWDAMFAQTFTTIALGGGTGGTPTTLRPNAVIRLGWESYGNTYAWAGAANASDYVAAYRHIVLDVARPISSQFKFDWNGAKVLASGYDGMTGVGYPGDDVVDYVGADIYDTSTSTSGPFGAAGWNNTSGPPYGQNSQLSLQEGYTFAQAHGKLFTIPEFGVGTGTFGGGDDPLWFTSLINWVFTTPGVGYVMVYDRTQTNTSMFAANPNTAAVVGPLIKAASIPAVTEISLSADVVAVRGRRSRAVVETSISTDVAVGPVTLRGGTVASGLLGQSLLGQGLLGGSGPARVPVILTRVITEHSVSVDGVTQVARRSRAVVEGSSSIDSVARFIANPRVIAENSASGDTLTALSRRQRGVAEASVSTDFPVSHFTYPRITAENSLSSDTVGRSLPNLRSLAEVSLSADVASRRLAAARFIIESSTGMDVLSTAVGRLQAYGLLGQALLGQGVLGGGGILPAGHVAIAISDSSFSSDIVRGFSPPSRAVSEGSNSVDTVSSFRSLSKSISDSSASVDLITLHGSFIRAVVEGSASLDAVLRFSAQSRGSNESSISVDAIVRLPSHESVIADPSVSLDIITRVVVTLRVCADNSISNDVLALATKLHPAVPEFSVSMDILATQLVFGRSASDNSVSGDVISRHSFLGASCNDQSASTDSIDSSTVLQDRNLFEQSFSIDVIAGAVFHRIGFANDNSVSIDVLGQNLATQAFIPEVSYSGDLVVGYRSRTALTFGHQSATYTVQPSLTWAGQPMGLVVQQALQ